MLCHYSHCFDLRQSQIHNRRDHASCVEVVFQREIGPLAVISSYYDKTPLFNQQRDNVVNVMNQLEMLHYIIK